MRFFFLFYLSGTSGVLVHRHSGAPGVPDSWYLFSPGIYRCNISRFKTLHTGSRCCARIEREAFTPRGQFISQQVSFSNDDDDRDASGGGD